MQTIDLASALIIGLALIVGFAVGLIVADCKESKTIKMQEQEIAERDNQILELKKLFIK